MALPKRWEPYSAVGNRIEGTRFISFKVPLDKKLCSKLPEKLRFSPDLLVDMIEARGQKLALVIDLTNTTRYYSKEELVRRGIKYHKIFTEGKRVPKDAVINSFYRAVDEVLQDADEDSLIGVHCTHGVNRTGYLVCRYMVEKMSIPPEEAIAAFTKARGHPIERENYIEDLKLRKDGGQGLPKVDEKLQNSNDDRSGGDNPHLQVNDQKRYGVRSDPYIQQWGERYCRKGGSSRGGHLSQDNRNSFNRGPRQCDRSYQNGRRHEPYIVNRSAPYPFPHPADRRGRQSRTPSHTSSYYHPGPGVHGKYYHPNDSWSEHYYGNHSYRRDNEAHSYRGMRQRECLREGWKFKRGHFK